MPERSVSVSVEFPRLASGSGCPRAMRIGAKRPVVGAHDDLRDWLAQRVTAIIMAIHALILLMWVFGARNFLPTVGAHATAVRHRGNKASLPVKLCVVCGLPMSWRRRWARNWSDVKYCSDACRRGKRRHG